MRGFFLHLEGPFPQYSFYYDEFTVKYLLLCLQNSMMWPGSKPSEFGAQKIYIVPPYMSPKDESKLLLDWS